MHASLNSFSQAVFPLYPGVDTSKIGGRENRQEVPQLIYYKANGSSGRPCVLICPGGGYTALAMDHEGRQVAAFFNARGYDAFILMYRLNDIRQTGSRHPSQHDDVTTALRMIKYKANSFGIDASKVGILGFSAGGHLASMASTMFREILSNTENPLEGIDSRPSFSILIYPVISMVDSFTHRYSREMLLGKDASDEMKDSLSTYKRITTQTPPTFIVFASDDKSVPVHNGIVYYQALLKNGVKASMHIFDHGGHGFGMAPADPVLNRWPDLAIGWLEQLGIKGVK